MTNEEGNKNVISSLITLVEFISRTNEPDKDEYNALAQQLVRTVADICDINIAYESNHAHLTLMCESLKQENELLKSRLAVLNTRIEGTDGD